MRDSVLEVSCCGWLASVCGVCLSTCEEIGKPFFVVVVNVCVEYFVYEKVSWYCVEGLAYVYGG